LYELTLEEAIEEYLYHCLARGFTEKTMKNKRQEYRQLKEYLAEKRGVTVLQSITIYDLKSYVRYKQLSGLQPQSIVSMFKMIKAFFAWCEKEEYIENNIATKVETPKVPKKVLTGFTEAEVQGMIESFTFRNYLEARNKAIIAMLADCGVRAMEIRGLRNDNFTETSILVHGKGNKERIAFISPALKRILIRYERIKRQYFQDKVTTDHYFLSYTGKGLSHVALDNIVKEAGKRAGIEGKRVSPHSFRHFYSVQSLTNGGIDVYSLSRLLGHSDLSITQRYLQSLTDEQLSTTAISSSPLMNLNKGK
jgi:integrase/recombinase XerD